MRWSGSAGGQGDNPGGPQAQGDGRSGGARGLGYLSHHHAPPGPF